MPTPYIEKLSRQGYGSVQRLELLWAKAKEKADKAGRGRDYAYLTGIFNRMVGLKDKSFAMNTNSLLRQVASRLRVMASESIQRVDSVSITGDKGSYSGTFAVSAGSSLVVKDKGRELLCLMPPFGSKLTFPAVANAITIRASKGTHTGMFTLTVVSKDMLVGTVYAVKDKTGSTLCELTVS